MRPARSRTRLSAIESIQLLCGLAVAVLSLSCVGAAPLWAGDAADPFSAVDRAYWAFSPIRRPPLPVVAADRWVQSPVDAFILARLKQSGLTPLREADPRTLLRRAVFDLHGLPPTPEQLAQFLADDRPDAYERLIDRLMASPRYGERWGRHWLDLVRYADSDGFKADEIRPAAWRYRDWVVDALNQDKPYDQFVLEQLAGDEQAPGDWAALVATGFLRHTPYEYNQAHVRQQWENILNDITDVSTQVFLGLTIRCARCHDHKYDPILQRDYFRFQAFFAPLDPRSEVPLATPAEGAEYSSRLAEWQQATRELRDGIESIQGPYVQQFLQSRKLRFPKDIQGLLDKSPSARSPDEEQLALLAARQLVVAEAEMAAQMKPDDRKQWEGLREQLKGHPSGQAPELPTVLAARDVGPTAPPTRIPGGGENGDEENVIAPGVLSILDASDASIASPGGQPTSTGRRTALARWLTSAENPLPSRVIVNRLWQHHFGQGLVATPNDFGRQGEAPSHPELLDWLAAELVERDWSLKSLHRAMLLSATYRQASAADAPSRASEVDPENRLLWRMNVRRLEAEGVRDTLLAASGELNGAVGGPAVFPPLPADLQSSYGWQPTADPFQQVRRSAYLVVKRNLREPLLDAFDPVDSHDTCARRDVTTTAPQALVMLNGEWVYERAAAMAGLLLRQAGDDEGRIVTLAYARTLAREPSPEELELANLFLGRQADLIRDRLNRGESVPRPAGATAGGDAARHAAVVDFCHALFNSNEFIYVD